MDKKQQAERIEKPVNSIAGRAVALPPNERPAFIKGEIAKVREAFRQTYEADPRLAAYAMEFVDTMYGWVKGQVKALEKERHTP